MEQLRAELKEARSILVATEEELLRERKGANKSAMR